MVADVDDGLFSGFVDPWNEMWEKRIRKAWNKSDYE